MENKKVLLTIPSCLSNLSLIRSFVRVYLENLDVPKKYEVHLLSVVDELATNAIEHGYKYNKGDIMITLDNFDDSILISVEDFGNGYKDDEESKEDGGIGLAITKKLVDEFIIEKKDRGTKIRVRKKVKEAV